MIEPSVDQLRQQLADLLNEHPMMDWSPGLIRAVVAVLDLHPDQDATTAPVLTLVPGVRKPSVGAQGCGRY